jgi:hypothetical protein
MRSATAMVLAALLALPFACSDDPPPPVFPKPTDPKPTGPYADMCITLCDNYRALGCEVERHCAVDCVESLETATNCSTEFYDWIACLSSHDIPGCRDRPPECEDAFDRWRACPVNAGCGPVFCDERSDDACTCSAICQDSEYEEHCDIDGSHITCECRVDGEVEVVCRDSEFACAFFIGCCSWILPDPPVVGGMGGMGMGGVGGVGNGGGGGGGGGGVGNGGGGGGGEGGGN